MILWWAVVDKTFFKQDTKSFNHKEKGLVYWTLLKLKTSTHQKASFHKMVYPFCPVPSKHAEDGQHHYSLLHRIRSHDYGV